VPRSRWHHGCPRPRSLEGGDQPQDGLAVADDGLDMVGGAHFRFRNWFSAATGRWEYAFREVHHSSVFSGFMM